MIKQNAVSIDGEKIGDTDFNVEPAGDLILKVGKRRFCRIVFS
jgi:tyrosyl-tRNA synthetase